MDQEEWINYDVEDNLKIWLEKFKPSQILKTSSSGVCGIAISVPISSDHLNNNTSELEEGFRSLTSQKDDMRLLHVEAQATTVFVSTDKLLLKVNSHHVDDVWRGLITNLHEGQFGQKVHRVEVSLAADMNKMKTDYVICVYNENFVGTYQSLNGNGGKENNNDPVIDVRNVVRNKNAKIRKPCKYFNEGSCEVKRAHLSKSRLTRWLHVCRFCFAKYGNEKLHPESQCEYKKNANDEKNADDEPLSRMTRSVDESKRNKKVRDEDENIMKSREGSDFTLVTSNVYPTCSCRGGSKGCSTNTCKCIKFSQECLKSCGCGQSCTNVGLTRGEGKRLRIGKSRVQGDGCFTEEDIGKGEYVGEYTGKLVRRADQLKKKNPSKFLFEIGHNDFLLDAEEFGSKLAKMNHKTEKTGANCVYKLKRADREWKVGVWAFKNIKKDEELFANYSGKYRGHGLFTPTKKKNKKGRRKGAKIGEKERQRTFIENQLPQSPRPAAFISNATKISNEEIKSSPILKRKTRSFVSKEKSVGASSSTDLSTPIHIVGGVKSSPSNCEMAHPRRLKLDSSNKTQFEEEVKSNPNVATKMAIFNAYKENVRMPTVTITPKENDICKRKLYDSVTPVRSSSGIKVTPERSTSGIKVIPVRSSPRIKATAVRSTPGIKVTPARSSPRIKATALRSTPGIKVTPVRSSPRIKATAVRSTPGIKVTPVRSSPRIKAKADEELPVRSLVVEYKDLSVNPGDVEQDIDEEERT